MHQPKFFLPIVFALLASGCAQAQDVAPDGAPQALPVAAPQVEKASAPLMAPKLETTARGAAYDRVAMFASKGRFPAVEAWLGREMPFYSIFTARISPAAMQGATRQGIKENALLQSVKGRVRLCVQIPLAFGKGGAKTPEGVIKVRGYLAETANGDHDKYFLGAARNLKDAGYGDAIVRLGHEFSGRWYPWSAVENPEGYAKAFRHVVTLFRSVSPDFAFDFNGSSQDFGKWAEAAYPGDDYVDIVGTDIYDRGLGKDYFSAEKKGWKDPEKAWSEGFLPRLEVVREFALKKGKPLSIPEWGIEGVGEEESNGIEGRLTVGGDNPVFIHRIADWMNALPKEGPASLAYHSYFWTDSANEGPHTLDKLPRAAQAFLEEFGNPEKERAPIPVLPVPAQPVAAPVKPVTLP